MRYIARVMTMGDMSPSGLSYAFYNLPDGEPEDVVLEVLNIYESEEDMRGQIDKDISDFENMTGCTLEEGGGWVEVEELDYA